MIVSRFDYAFTAATRLVTLGEKFRGLRISQIALITNLTRGTTIYRFDTLTLSGVLAGLELTLTYDTTAHADDDDLQIILDQPFADDTLLEIKALLKKHLEVNRQILAELKHKGER